MLNKMLSLLKNKYPENSFHQLFSEELENLDSDPGATNLIATITKL